jgi:c-di-GMP-related signal transduction protein
VAAVGGLATPRDAELLQTCLFRARFGELLASRIGLPLRALDLFWCGLLSGLGPLTGQPLPALLASLGVPADLQRAVLGDPGAGALGRGVQLVERYEAADWPAVEALQLALDAPGDALPGLFSEAASWARTAMAAASTSVG